MPPNMIMTKVPEYPRPHDWEVSFSIPVESAAARHSTIIPICTYDEGLGAMSAYESNPTNASFVEAATDHCFPTSKVNRVFAKLEVNMSKSLMITDNIQEIKFATSTIHTSFMDGELALDEVSTLDLNEILELQNEQTDRQTYPLYNAIDLNDYKSNAKLNMPAETLGLDTDLELEGVATSLDDIYDCLHYYTNGKKLRSIFEPIRWHTLSKTHPSKTIFFSQQSNTKFMNPYTMLAAWIHVPQMSDIQQIGEIGNTTIETCELQMYFTARYNEFNHEFNHSML